MRPYPYKQLTLTRGPVEVLFWDEACQAKAVCGEVAGRFTGADLTPTLSVLTWLQVMPARLTLLTVSRHAASPAYVEDQPGSRS